MLDANRETDHVFGHAGLEHFVRSELAVRGRCRVAGQRLVVADIDQSGKQLQCILEATASSGATLDAEGENAGGATAQKQSNTSSCSGTRVSA